MAKDLVIIDVQDAPNFDAFVAAMGDKKFARKVSQAATRIAKETRTDLSKRIREIYAIKKKDLDPGIRIERSTFDGYPVIEIRVAGSPINISKFDAIGVRRVAGGVKVNRTSGTKLQKRAKLGTGINALIKKGKGRTNLPSAFFAKLTGTPERVFQRGEAGNLISVNIITIASMAENPDVQVPVIAQALDAFDKELARIAYLDI
jgi:hypothetical protein